MESSQALTRHERETKNLRIAVQRAEDVVGKLQDALEEDRIEEGRLQALKSHLKEAEEELVIQQGSFEESVFSKDRASDSLKIAREQLTAIDLRIEETTTKLKKAESEALKCTKKRAADLMDKNAAINGANDSKERLAHDEARRLEIIDVIENYTEQAGYVSARVPVPPGETGESLERKMEKIKRDITRATER